MYLIWECLLWFTLITSSFSLRSQTNNFLRRFQMGYDTCSSGYSGEAEKEIQRVFSVVTEGEYALANPRDYPIHYDPTDFEVFDFIVVGAGSAGSVVANRLSEVPGWNVLLLEAGGNPTKTSEVPALVVSLQKTDIDWQYQSDPDEDNCLGFNGNRCLLPRGKVLGGSSTINYMLYLRGNADDYDGWEADGNVGWGYKDVLPYFMKLEDMRDKKVQESPDFDRYHSQEGPQKVEAWATKEVQPLVQVLSEGMAELGYPTNYDVNGPSQTGYVILQGTLDNGRRCSTAKSYLKPARQRHNLRVSKHSLVSKVLVDKHKTAYGVQFIDKHGRVKTVIARKEVILSAGAINTPQLLMLAGIGPKAHLDKLNISVVQDLPVGRNLQDHPAMLGVVISLEYDQPTKSAEERMFEFLLRNDSAYSSLSMVSFPSLINTVSGANGDPDMMVYTYDFGKNDTTKLTTVLDGFNVREEIQKHYLEIVKTSYMLIMISSLLQPSSKGSIELRSTDPKEYPKIITGYFTNQTDIDKYLHTYAFLYSLAATKSMANKNATLHEIKVPGCAQYRLGSEPYRVCAIKQLTTTTYHQSGTCKMGPADSPDSVVDPQLRVKGVHGLRVVDASIMPKIPAGNTNVPVIMVAEKGADLIKASHRQN